ncbi:MAG: ribonuclease Z [Prevotellaceae bacterium]|jgi:ribonuclease Z|nr:ribonuclease Z [Prevotellaceae bacterium]
MTFSLTILGSNSALPAKDRFTTAHALNVHERFFLIDCGEGTQLQMRRYGVRFSRLDHIFISHLHGDHFLGIYGLLSTYSLLGRTRDMHIYGAKQLEYVLNDYLKYFGKEFSYKVIYHEVNPRSNDLVHEDKSLTVHAIPLNHRIPCCGYLFREKTPQRCIHKWIIEKYNIGIADIVRIKNGEDYKTNDGEVIPNAKLSYQPYEPRSYAFCSDTRFSEKVIEAVKGVDLLYHESTFADDLKDTAKQTGHSTAREAAIVAQKANVKRLVIGHFSSRYKDLQPFAEQAKEVFSNTELAEDGRVFDVPLIKYSG